MIHGGEKIEPGLPEAEHDLGDDLGRVYGPKRPGIQAEGPVVTHDVVFVLCQANAVLIFVSNPFTRFGCDSLDETTITLTKDDNVTTVNAANDLTEGGLGGKDPISVVESGLHGISRYSVTC